MAGELVAPGLHQHFSADDCFGSFVEAWLAQLRRAQESPTIRTTGIQRHFLRLHEIVAPIQQSRQLYDIMCWRQGKLFNLRFLLTVANWNPPELTSTLLPATRVINLEVISVAGVVYQRLHQSLHSGAFLGIEQICADQPLSGACHLSRIVTGQLRKEALRGAHDGKKASAPGYLFSKMNPKP